MTEAEHRAAVVKEALTWAGTPYHLHGAVKGAGADCATLILAIYHSQGLTDQTNHGMLASDWWLHSGTNYSYLRGLLQYCSKAVEGVCYKTLKALPGNTVTTQVAGAKEINHGGLVIKWPQIIHAVHPKVQLVDVTKHPMWVNKQVQIWDPWLKLASGGPA